jgi:nucleotide-binding universal stress UspA family protein
MYQKILVAYDGSSFSDVALHRGSKLARLCNAQLHLVGVVSTSGYMALAEGTSGIDIWGMERGQLEEALERAARGLSSEGLNATTSIREGIAVNEIADCAAEQGAGIVILGHSDKGILARWLEGATGAGLLHKLPCDLLVATG